MDMKISPSMLACDFANMGAEANNAPLGVLICCTWM